MSIIGSLRRVLFGPPADADPRDARLTEYAIGAKGYVHVEEDGEARELSEDEVEYLNTAFHPCDGARPYI